MASEATIVTLSADEQVVTLVLRMLEGQNFDIRAVRSCDACLRTVRSLMKLDLLIADAHTVTSAGFDLVSEVRASFPDVAILYMSDVQADTTGLRKVTVIVKPFTRVNLIDHVTAALAQRKPPQSEGLPERWDVPRCVNQQH